MNGGRAFPAGVIGAIVMTILMALGRMINMTHMNLELALGSMMTHTITSWTWLMGLVIHLIVGGILALIYAAGFEYWAHRATWQTGAGLGAVHVVIAGLVMGMMGKMHPLMVPPPPPPPPGHLLAPGVFGSNFGMMTVLWRDCWRNVSVEAATPAPCTKPCLRRT